MPPRNPTKNWRLLCSLIVTTSRKSRGRSEKLSLALLQDHFDSSWFKSQRSNSRAFFRFKSDLLSWFLSKSELFATLRLDDALPVVAKDKKWLKIVQKCTFGGFSARVNLQQRRLLRPKSNWLKTWAFDNIKQQPNLSNPQIRSQEMQRIVYIWKSLQITEVALGGERVKGSRVSPLRASS